MKKILSLFLSLALCLGMLLSLFGCLGGDSSTTTATTTTGAMETTTTIGTSTSTTTTTTSTTTSITTGSSDNTSAVLDFYSINDLHGHVNDNDDNVGIARLSSFFLNKSATENAILLSAGDMWQGGVESNNTKGKLVTDWMNQMNFAAMTVGNHDFDWGTEKTRINAQMAEFPMLGINVYSRATNQRVDFCHASTMIEKEGVKIGIIGAIGDVYSSISASRVQDIYFKVGNELTSLVKAESEKLRQEGADIIVYIIHEGYATKTTNTSYPINDSKLEHYDTSLSNGYVDLVFEGHTHTQNIYTDKYGVYHMQAGGENDAIAHLRLTYNKESKSFRINTSELIRTSYLSGWELNQDTLALFDKYAEEIGDPYEVLGTNVTKRNSSYLKQLVAQLYLKAGLEKWGEQYNIVLGGGKITCRDPYYLYVGDVCYADLLMLFPFDNDLVLCSIKGSDLKSRFLENDGYNIELSDFGIANQNDIVDNATYYIITDSYCSDYTWNRLTVVDVYSLDGIYARDLLAEYAQNGGFSK